MDLIFSVHTVNGADGPGLSSISPEHKSHNENMAAPISNYKLATKQKYGAIQPDGTVPKI